MIDDGATTGSGGLTTSGVERAVAVLLGADEATARDAVAVLEGAGCIHEGAAVHALVLAARRGTDAASALHQIANGREPAASWSAFELRVAAEEAADDLAPVRAAAGGGVVTLDGPDVPLRAAHAVRRGVHTLVVAAADPAQSQSEKVELAWVSALAAAAGCEVEHGAAPTSPPPPEQIWDRADDYLDVLELL